MRHVLDRPRAICRALFARSAVAALALAVLAGCSGTYNTPPSALGSSFPGGLSPRGQHVVVVGDFQNPVRTPVTWRDTGPGVARAMSQALLNGGAFDVWTNEQLAAEVQRVLAGPTHLRADALGVLHDRHEAVRYVIVGQVTDFHYTSEVSREVRRRAWPFGGHREEAIVAIEFQMVDLQARRLVVADHVFGTARIRARRSKPVYEDLAFGSYLFWNSPMGQATETAVRRAMDRIEQVVPIGGAPGAGAYAIAREPSGRTVVVEPSAGLQSGAQFHVVGDDGEALRDPLTDRPVRVRILSVHEGFADAFLIGEPPEGARLAGAELRRPEHRRVRAVSDAVSDAR